ncbi:MAG: prepilin-type N-terminal cleavage/methylation domain-containing protein [Desulfobacter sp.]|nr:MAG: prepilin-type N-terminal cleavage/methylation domain-containing protein [Desulfobacter sp.]
MALKNKNLLNGRKESGFSLLEVLIAIVVLSVGLLAISMMQAHFASGNSQSRQMTRGTDIAMDHIETLSNLTNLDDSRLDVGNHTLIINTFERDYTLSWTVTDNNDRTLSIDISVSWNSNGLTHTVNFPWVKSI